MKEDLDGDIFDLEQVPLDKAWNTQAKLYWTYAKQLADARESYDRAKARRDVVSAELDQDVRLNPEDYKISKVTETAVQNAILSTGGYKEANEGVIKAKHKVDVLQAFVDALDHRKKALEAKVTLFVHEYYAEPKNPKGEEARDKANDMMKRETRKRMQESVNRK